MKNTTLLFRSFAVIIVIVGAAHLMSFNSAAKKSSVDSKPFQTSDLGDASNPQDQTESISENYNPETDYILGKWKVNYNSEEYTGAIVYSIKKEDEDFVAYTYQYQNEKGESEQAELTKSLVIKNFDGYAAKAVYTFEYEGQSYQVDVQIDMTDENTFKLSYDFYGYADIETWKRVTP